jgi:twitching motility protein PilT
MTPDREPAPAPAVRPPPPPERDFVLRAALEEMVRRGASDLHLKVGRPPVLRINGYLFDSEMPPLRPEDLKRCLEQVVTAEQRDRFMTSKEMDFAVGVQGLGRFRVNVFQQRGTLGFTMRAIPFEVPSLDELRLPTVLQEIALYPRGLVLVTGITGSGKSTTLASMIRHLNERRAVNIVSVEDPIEFLHRDSRSYISQREVGMDTLSFHEALRHVLRQDPDVIMLGEIRDRETMETCLKAADTGHLVLSTLHTTDASQTIGRIISFFPPHQQDEIRKLLAGVLRAVVSLRLIPKLDGEGRAAAAEVMVNTAAIAERIRSGDQIHAIPELMAEGRVQYGMQTFDQSLMELYKSDKISFDWAMFYASNPGEFSLRASGVEGTSDMGWSSAPEGTRRQG